METHHLFLPLPIQLASDSTTAFTVKDKDGNDILLVDTTNNRVKVGSGQIDASTGIKEFGLYDYSPTAGYHNPMVSMNGLTSTSGSLNEADVSMFGNGTDPATALDLSADGTNKTLLNALWYLPYNITIMEIRVWGATDAAQALNFHVYSYDVKIVTSNFGDLSNGTLLAHIGSSMSATADTLKTDTLTIDSASVASTKGVIAFVEGETDTTDITCTMTIKYRID